MQITNSFGIGSASSIQGTNRSNAIAQPAALENSSSILNPQDQVEFSPEAQAILAGEGAETENRTERIAEIRRQIADGSYDTDEKISAALDRFLDVYS